MEHETRITQLERNQDILIAQVLELVYIVGNIGGIDVRKLSQISKLKNLSDEDQV